MRIIAFFVLLTIALIEIGPVPITPFVLIWVVLFRPAWFYEWVQKIYRR